MLDTFQMVSEAVSFTEPRFGPGRCDYVFVACFRRTFSRDVPRSEELCIGLVVLASGDAHLAITVLCGSVFTFTDFFPLSEPA